MYQHEGIEAILKTTTGSKSGSKAVNAEEAARNHSKKTPGIFRVSENAIRAFQKVVKDAAAPELTCRGKKQIIRKWRNIDS